MALYIILDAREILTCTASYGAWLRSDGEHQTKARGYRNWNKEVLQDMAADIESPWSNLLSDIRAHQLQLRHDIFACWEEAVADLGLSPWKSPINYLSF